MNFDEILDRRDTHSSKWDTMEKIYGVSPSDGLAMWVADMDFRAPQGILDTLQTQIEHGILGYFGDDREYIESIQWWMDTRHGWSVDSESIFSTHGLVHGAAMCIDTFTEPDDGVILFTPVYHSFAKVIKANNRRVVECELAQVNNQYKMDFDTYDAQMDGTEKMLILCSPHNPGGRVWTIDELIQVAAFAKRHNLIIVSDEIHHDIIMPGNKHIPMAFIDTIQDRLIMMTATTKTFNIPATHVGNVIIHDHTLRKKFAKRITGLGLSPNAFGMSTVPAAYSPEGAVWVDELITYLNENRRIFDESINAIPGLKSMPLEATYLSWVDFSGTGMTRTEFTHRVQRHAKIAANHGLTFGKGGDNWLRFNIAMPRVRIQEAVDRLAQAFRDLQ
jgi:cystathionine beta-lyase